MIKKFSIITIGFLLSSNLLISQNTEERAFSFQTKFYDAIDKWIAFPKKEQDTSYIYGFIYIDATAGITFNYESNFTVKNSKLYSKPGSKSSMIKRRLAANTMDVYILSEQDINDLKLPKAPDWLKIYKSDEGSVDYLKNMGFHYNHVGASHQALIPLLHAYKKNPHYDGLEFEIAYAYNATKQYKEAIQILDKAIKHNSKNFFLYRELGFAYKYLNQHDKAEDTYKKGISMSDNDFEKSEMAVNMAHTYFEMKNKKKFDEWAAITRQYAKKDSQYLKYIEQFEQSWNK